MNNDLISRSALREEVNAFYDSHFKGLVPNELITYAEAVDDLIDNAPTVKAFTVDEVEEIRQATMEQVRISCKQNERPQGEWIDYDNTFYKCPECGYLLLKDCPYCQNKVILPIGGAS